MPKLRASAPVSRSIGVPSWVPEVEIDAAQERRRIEPRAAERFLHELRQRRSQAGDLRRETRRWRAAVRAAFGLQAVDQAFVQPLAPAARTRPAKAAAPPASVLSSGNVVPQTAPRFSRSRSSKNSVKPASRSALVNIA